MIDAYGWFKGGNPTIKGETNDKQAKEKDGFDILEFGFGVENIVNVGSSSGGLGSGRAVLEKLTISKFTDTATCDMVKAACTGAHIPEFHLSIRKGGADAATSGGEFVHVQMNNVVIESVKWAGADGDEAFKDEVVLAYASIELKYKKQGFDGKLTDAGKFQWSQTQNEAVLS
ncbi:MAG: type VI secretion system tube protein Hcp [Pseudomonadota bacterium]